MHAKVPYWLAKHTKLPPLGWLDMKTRPKVPTWEPKCMLKCPFQWQEHTVFSDNDILYITISAHLYEIKTHVTFNCMVM